MTLTFDFVVLGTLGFLLGFNVALIPAMLAETVPFLDLLPVWTTLVFYIRWKQT